MTELPSVSNGAQHKGHSRLKAREGLLKQAAYTSRDCCFHDVGAQLWTRCQSRCQLALSESYFTYEDGGEGNRTPVLVAIHANIYMFIRR